MIGPCVNSGYCCKVVPCPYGTVDLATGWCRYLEETATNRYICGRYDYIKKQPGADMLPAFGAGCCSTTNSDRMEILQGTR